MKSLLEAVEILVSEGIIRPNDIVIDAELVKRFHIFCLKWEHARKLCSVTRKFEVKTTGTRARAFVLAQAGMTVE